MTEHTQAEAAARIEGLRQAAVEARRRGDRRLAVADHLTGAARRDALAEGWAAEASAARFDEQARWLESKLRSDCPACGVMHTTVTGRLRCPVNRREG